MASSIRISSLTTLAPSGRKSQHSSPYSPRDDDRDGWRRASWLYSPHALLDEQTPADVFPDSPLRVIKGAPVEFRGDPDAP
ncbi:hypothetical protein [Paraburkholderia xenovorans]|uniref:hypothetical protein n=1 Tax=Paraburkholderia xenovorans TaxID=36873 RepID=UPI000B01022B|nr:hypothetical protein [Paraburkholderia xenovorans]